MNKCTSEDKIIQYKEITESGSKLQEENKNSDEIKEKGLNTYYTSNIIKKTFFFWVLYATQLANKNPLKISDFQSIGEEDRAEIY